MALLGDGILEGALGGAARGAIIGGIAGFCVWIVMEIRKRSRQNAGGKSDDTKGDN
jgi:hypothetical protein